ncbi:rab-GTPase-TBC domain-containing protein [Aspergillus desertorum]
MATGKAQQQEMVQVDRSEQLSSPFWKARSVSQNQRSPNSLDQSLVVGASYSHASIPNGLPQHTQSRTPPRSSSNNSSHASPSTRRPRIWVASPGASYSGIMNQELGPWDHGDPAEKVGEDEDDIGEDIVFDDDEDEFGLPSIASMRKRQSRKADVFHSKTVEAPTFNPNTENRPSTLGVGLPNNRQRANSSDIAEERDIPLYPAARKGDGKILRPQYKDILKDPANALNLINHAAPERGASSKDIDAYTSRISRVNKFKRLLQASIVPLSELRNLAWSGVPDEVRAMTWQLLLGYLPTNSERRIATLERKRKEYLDGVRQAFERSTAATTREDSRSTNTGRGRCLDEAIWHQISIDVPRTSPHIQLYGYEATQRSLERILYVWAIRHPASGYVQGINDLVTPLFQVFLGIYVTDLNVEEGMDPGQLPRSVLDAVEADSFWCLTKLLDGIQDNYIYAQPGIHRQVRALRDLIMRIDANLAKHLEQEGVEFMQFSFRWMNCLLMREMSIRNTIRMWDTYMAEEQGFSRFHLYVCAAFLVKWTDQLMKMDFQEIMMFLQALPTKDWTEKDIELLLSEAFIWQTLFHDSRAHLRPSTGDHTPNDGFQ